MVSDISNVPRLGYVGIDNRAAGRLAGHLLGRSCGRAASEVALFAGSLSYRGHEEREMGFRHILAEEYLTSRPSSCARCGTIRSAPIARRGRCSPPIATSPGIYNIGAGNRGIARALEESGRAGEVVFVCHEVTEFTRRYLLAGTVDAVIDQNPRVEARDAIDRLCAARRPAAADLPPIRIQAVFKENIPQVRVHGRAPSAQRAGKPRQGVLGGRRAGAGQTPAVHRRRSAPRSARRSSP